MNIENYELVLQNSVDNFQRVPCIYLYFLHIEVVIPTRAAAVLGAGVLYRRVWFRMRLLVRQRVRFRF